MRSKGLNSAQNVKDKEQMTSSRAIVPLGAFATADESSIQNGLEKNSAQQKLESVPEGHLLVLAEESCELCLAKSVLFFVTTFELHVLGVELSTQEVGHIEHNITDDESPGIGLIGSALAETEESINNHYGVNCVESHQLLHNWLRSVSNHLVVIPDSQHHEAQQESVVRDRLEQVKRGHFLGRELVKSDEHANHSIKKQESASWLGHL